MIIGVNGFKSKARLSSHDASACLLAKDGRIVAACEEERLTREKRAVGVLPSRAVEYCVGECGQEEITDLAIGWDYRVKYNFQMSDDNFLNCYLPGFAKRKKIKVHHIDHHLAHACASFYFSGFDEANIMVIDGRGENFSTSLYEARDNTFKKIISFPIKDSLGFMLEELGNALGMGIYAAGKIMALASYSKNMLSLPLVKLFDNGYELDISDNSKPYYSWKKIYLDILQREEYPARRRMHLEEFDDRELDLAHSVQKCLEEIIYHLAKLLYKKNNIKKFCLAGGVGLNCPANKKLLNSEFIDDIFIFPAANDAGCAVGAAAHVLVQKYGVRPEKLENVFLGPCTSRDEVILALKKHSIPYHEIKQEDEILEVCAKDLTKGRIVGWLYGKMEMGPRALGHRSILASPSLPDAVKKINGLKGREFWRPLAVSMLEDEVENYLSDFKKSSLDPYMLTTALGRKEKFIGDILHVDGTTRPQIVDFLQDVRFYKLIKKFKEVSGIPYIINTSFNTNDEPIACTPHDAIKSFKKMKLDALYLENFVIRK